MPVYARFCERDSTRQIYFKLRLKCKIRSYFNKYCIVKKDYLLYNKDTI